MSLSPRTVRNLNRSQSLVMTRIGGKDYPLRSEPNCRTCQSAYRTWIEGEIVHGRTYAAIARALEGQDNQGTPHPNALNLSYHVKNGHMPLSISAERRLVERRAEEVGRDFEDAGEDLVDYVTVAQMTVRRGFQRLVDGEIQPDLADVLAASRLLQQVDKEVQGGVDQAAFQQVLLAYMEVVTQFVPPERLQAMATAMRNHPVLHAFAQSQTATVEGRLADVDD